MEFLFGLFAGLIGVGICEYIAYTRKKPSEIGRASCRERV